MVVVAGRILVGQLRLRRNIRLRSRRVLGGARPSRARDAAVVAGLLQGSGGGGGQDGRRSRADIRPSRLLRLRSRNVAIGGAAARVSPIRQRRSSSSNLHRAMRRTATRLRMPSRS
ncbi:unnamed protein product [Meganyctiphanes norvegica]|uniref:Uncharacterized protein n=1 Tax=Meganyctiphanes norvegica TaxID=48144 RepID=A0AAV2RA83_MEGNR